MSEGEEKKRKPKGAQRGTTVGSRSGDVEKACEIERAGEVEREGEVEGASQVEGSRGGRGGW